MKMSMFPAYSTMSRQLGSNIGNTCILVVVGGRKLFRNPICIFNDHHLVENGQ